MVDLIYHIRFCIFIYYLHSKHPIIYCDPTPLGLVVSGCI